jgi:hypothetical protein
MYNNNANTVLIIKRCAIVVLDDVGAHFDAGVGPVTVAAKDPRVKNRLQTECYEWVDGGRQPANQPTMWVDGLVQQIAL